MSDQNQNPYGSYGQGPGSGQGQFGPQPGQGGSWGQNPAPGAYGQQASSGQFYGQQPWQGGQSQMPGYQQPAFDAYGNPVAADAKNMAALAHLSALLGLFVTATFANFLGPLIFWSIYKDRPGYAMVRASAAEAFNFSFTLWLVNIAVWVVNFATFGLALFFTWVIIGATFLLLAIFHIVAAVKASNGEPFTYPFAIRVLS